VRLPIKCGMNQEKLEIVYESEKQIQGNNGSRKKILLEQEKNCTISFGIKEKECLEIYL